MPRRRSGNPPAIRMKGADMADPNKPPRGFLIASLVFMVLWLGGCGVGCGGLISGARDLVDDAQNAQSSASGEPVLLDGNGDTGVIFTTSSRLRCAVQTDS